MASPSINDATIENLIRQGIPGFDEDWIRRTEAKLNAIRPLKNQAEQLTTKADLAKLKYSVLVQVMKKKSPKIKLPISLVSVVVKNSEQIESELLKEKLLQIEGGVKIITKKGERFVTEFDRTHKAQS